MRVCSDLIGVKMKQETKALPEFLQEKRELNIQISQLVEKAESLKPTEKQIEDYLREHGFERICDSFDEVDLSKLRGSLNEHNVFYNSSTGYLLRDSYALVKVNNPNDPKQIRRTIQDICYYEIFKKIQKSSALYGFIGGALVHYISSHFNSDIPPIVYSILTGFATFAASVTIQSIDHSIFANRSRTKIASSDEALEKLVEVCEGKQEEK